VHEDHDILGMFSPYEYTWTTTGKGLAQIGAFVATFFSVLYVVKLSYPDKRSYPREFEGGLEKELGGAGALIVSTGPTTWARADADSRVRQGRLVTLSHKEDELACTYVETRKRVTLSNQLVSSCLPSLRALECSRPGLPTAEQVNGVGRKGSFQIGWSCSERLCHCRVLGSSS
jgi:hypothetical protein